MKLIIFLLFLLFQQIYCIEHQYLNVSVLLLFNHIKEPFIIYEQKEMFRIDNPNRFKLKGGNAMVSFNVINYNAHLIWYRHINLSDKDKIEENLKKKCENEIEIYIITYSNKISWNLYHGNDIIKNFDNIIDTFYFKDCLEYNDGYILNINGEKIDGYIEVYRNDKEILLSDKFYTENEKKYEFNLNSKDIPKITYNINQSILKIDNIINLSPIIENGCKNFKISDIPNDLKFNTTTGNIKGVLKQNYKKDIIIKCENSFGESSSIINLSINQDDQESINDPTTKNSVNVSKTLNSNTKSCSVNNGDCDKNAYCTTLQSGVNQCTCKDGYIGNGKTCHITAFKTECDGKKDGTYCYPSDCCKKVFKCENEISSRIELLSSDLLCYNNEIINITEDENCEDKHCSLSICGDGVCYDTESCEECPKDCGECISCGDGICSSGETMFSCSTDCGSYILNSEDNVDTNFVPDKVKDHSTLIYVLLACFIGLLFSAVIIIVVSGYIYVQHKKKEKEGSESKVIPLSPIKKTKFELLKNTPRESPSPRDSDSVQSPSNMLLKRIDKEKILYSPRRPLTPRVHGEKLQKDSPLAMSLRG